MKRLPLSSKAEIAGYIAGKDGEQPSSCPFPKGERADAWMRGYALGQRRREAMAHAS